MIAGGTHIDHADLLRAGSTASVLGHRVMAPSTIGTFLRAFTFGHVRQLEAVNGHALERAWAAGVVPVGGLVIDLDSTICPVDGVAKQSAGYGYTGQLGYHPILATRADTGEILHARMRRGQANTQRGARRFIDESALSARARHGYGCALNGSFAGRPGERDDENRQVAQSHRCEARNLRLVVDHDS